MAKSRRGRPVVNRRCVASHYEAPNEAIVEVSSEVGGCLISARTIGTGEHRQLLISVYRADSTVNVAVSSEVETVARYEKTT